MHSTQAIILKRENFREHDERIFLYTRDFGKIIAVAKGVKRIEAKLRGNLDVLNFVNITFVNGAYFPIITSVEGRRHFPDIIRKVSVYGAACLAASIIVDIFEENIKDEKFFDVFFKLLSELESFSVSKDAKADLHVWTSLKKFQFVILEGQGYESQIPKDFIKNGDIRELDNFFERTFAYHFNFKLPLWLLT